MNTQKRSCRAVRGLPQPLPHTTTGSIRDPHTRNIRSEARVWTLLTLRGPQVPEQGKHAPEVGLGLHSLPRKHWEPGETCGIRPDSATVRPDPTPEA